MRFNSFVFVLIVFLALATAVPVHAVLPESSIKVFAVSPDGTAIDATLTLKTAPGTGVVWSSVSGPLVGTATQSTEKIAVKVARNYSTEVDKYDYFFAIDSEASVVDGPSAGSAMALLVVSALQNKTLSPDVGLTGTITNAGEVGPVGGVYEKAKEAARVGVKLFLIPRGESSQVVKFPDGVKNISLPEYALKEWGMKVVETGTLDDVLHYAFTDISSIDITQTTPVEEPAYIPEKIPVNDTVKPMETLNKKFIEETRELLKDAQAALNQTLLDDAGLIEVLSRTLGDSEKTVNEAELLVQNGYQYSAGNYTFLAKVNAYFVHDVSENPDLIDLESDALLKKVNELEKLIDARQKVFDSTVPIEGVEWYIAAQQRLTWAQLEVNKLQDTQTIIVTTDDAIHAQAVGRVQDFEFARAWYESSNEFYNVALSLSTKGLKSQSPFVDYYSEFVENATNGLGIISVAEGEDAKRRLDAGLIDQSENRHLSAAMNSASALSLINAILIENDSNSDVRVKLEETIADLDEKMSLQEDRYAWPRLYLDHAKYYLNSANYYLGINQGASAASSLSSGLTLALLAENTYEVTKDVEDYYDKLPASRFTPLSSTSNGNGNGNVIPITIGEDGTGSLVVQAGENGLPVQGILLAIALFLAVVLAASFISKRGQKVLDTPLQAVSTSPVHGFPVLMRVDQLEAQLMAARQGLRHAEHRFKQGELTKTAYGEMASHYQSQLRGITKDLRVANLELRAGDKKSEKKMSTLLDTSKNVNESKTKKSSKKWPAKKVSTKKIKGTSSKR